MNNAVAIIVYSEFPLISEIASFCQCVEIFKTHKICIIAPSTLQCSVYTDIISKTFVHWNIQRFDDACFRSIQTYNKLMLSEHFYLRFADYDFILIYQLDAWVFTDELDSWCAKGYDYIGAPWFSDRGEMFAFAGNGGLSLRKVATFIDVLSKRDYSRHTWNQQFLAIEHPAKTPFRAQIKKLLHRVLMFFCRLSPRLFIKYNRDFEDMTFAKVFSHLGANRVAPPHIAAHFAFERFPEKLYELTGHRLPFGCHAFTKHNWEFWKDKISCTDTDKNIMPRDGK